MKNDIRNKSDIESLMKLFYERAKNDQLLAPHFEHINFDEHLPKIVHFWSFILLDEPGYTTQVFQVHEKMDINEKHFQHWVQCFQKVADELFEGPLTEMAKQRAAMMGWTFGEKMKKTKQ